MYSLVGREPRGHSCMFAGEKKCSRQPESLKGECAAGGLSPAHREQASPLRRGSVLWQPRSYLAVAGKLLFDFFPHCCIKVFVFLSL